MNVLKRLSDWLKKLYNWVLDWAKTPYAVWALFILAFCESSFFPIPPDVLLIAMGIAAPRKSFQYVLVCSIGSVMGGCFGYFLGWQFMEIIGQPLISFYGLTDQIGYVKNLYHQYDAWAIGIAGLTPIPYKLFTITAGAFKINFTVFVIASAISRTLRFALIGTLIYFFGAKIQYFLDKYFNWAVTIFTVLLIGGFVLVKYAVSG